MDNGSGRERLPGAEAEHAAPGEPDILIWDRSWRRIPRLRPRVSAAARAAGGGVSAVVLADDRTVKRLNARHRRRNKPTNVLSFDGELILAYGTIRREAAALRRRFAHHLAHLVVHGALHLRGHDHLAAGEARRMEQAEARILHRLRVPNPWKPR